MPPQGAKGLVAALLGGRRGGVLVSVVVDEPAPFQFFTDRIDPEIARATREGRRREFAAFGSFSGEDVPDPQERATFERSRVAPRAPDPLYRELLALRRELPRKLDVAVDGVVVTLRRGEVALVADLERRTVELRR